jgi:oligopeptide transport system permease protein
MGRYIIRRLLQFIPVFFAATFLIFFLVYSLPGDPIRALGGERGIPEPVYNALVERYNMDDPLLVQYGKYIGVIPDADPSCTDDPELRQQINRGEAEQEVCFNGVLQGDFGESFSRRDVGDILRQKVPTTARLALMAFAFEILIGIPAGVLAGLRRGSFMDNLVLISTTAVISIPVFVLGYSAQLLFGVRLGWLPVSASDGSFKSMILPAMVLGATSLAYVARLTRTSLVENMRADYVRTATAKGLPRRRVVGKHALRNSLIPVVTYLGIDLGALMGGAIITEGIFNVPGIGTEVFRAVRQQEGAVVVGIVTFLVLVYMVSTLIVDILYAYLDPRIRYD